MAGSLQDLNQPGAGLPPLVIVDSSVIMNWLEAIYVAGIVPSRESSAHQRALEFVQAVRDRQTLALITSVSLGEVFHVLVRTRFASAIPNHVPDLAARFPAIGRPKDFRWQHLFKARSDLLGPFVDEFHQIRLRMIASGLTFLQPTDLGPIPSGAMLEEELLDFMARYHLDTGDAAILLEAERAGVRNIVTSDADLYRARSDFDVYTWL